MNKYQCETCKKPHRVPNGLSRFPIFECCGDEMPFDTAISTAIRGCASHSDFESERDKVLKRMLECISQYEMLPNGMDFVIEDLLAELCQASEP